MLGYLITVHSADLFVYVSSMNGSMQSGHRLQIPISWLKKVSCHNALDQTYTVSYLFFEMSQRYNCWEISSLFRHEELQVSFSGHVWLWWPFSESRRARFVKRVWWDWMGYCMCNKVCLCCYFETFYRFTWETKWPINIRYKTYFVKKVLKKNILEKRSVGHEK